MTDLERLLAIEEIKRVKAKYFYCLDTKDWAGWKENVFAADGSLDVPEALAEPIVGIDKIIEWVSDECRHTSIRASRAYARYRDPVGGHREGDLGDGGSTLPAERQPHSSGFTYLHGFGHYHETYVRGPKGWRIKTTRLTRLRVETT